MKHWLSGLAVANLVIVAAVGLLPLAAHAQSGSLQATFTLPCTAHWGGAVLPPGNYTMGYAEDTDGTHDDSVLQVTSANGKSGVFIPSLQMGDKVANQDMLVLTVTGNSCEVRALNLASINREYVYKPISQPEEARIKHNGNQRLVAVNTKKQ